MTQHNLNIDLIRLYRQAEDYFFRSLSIQTLDIGHEVTAYMTEVPIKNLNPVYVKDHVVNLENALQQIQKFYDDKPIAFEIMIPDDLCTDQVDQGLRNLKYSQIDTSVAMAMTLKDIKVAACDIDIKIESMNTNLTDWSTPILDAFESTSEVMEFYTTSHQRALERGCDLYHNTLYHQSKPVTSLTLSIYNKSARMDDVGTLPHVQGKGYATYLVSHTLCQAQKMGATHCFLEASDRAVSLYQKMGFERLFQNHIYTLRSAT